MNISDTPVGVYSETAESLGGSMLCRDGSGKNVIVTALFPSVNHAREFYCFDDFKFVSYNIVEYLGMHSQGELLESL